MSRFIEQLGECTLKCQSIEFYFYCIISGGSVDSFLDADAHSKRDAANLTQHWNSTKQQLLSKCTNLDSARLDEYSKRRNWVIHNCVYEALSTLTNVHDLDISDQLDYFRREELYFIDLAKAAMGCYSSDKSDTSIIVDKLVDHRLASLAKEVMSRKKHRG